MKAPRGKRRGNGHTFPFEKLRVWQDSRELVTLIYSITKEFPKSELFGLSSQINRAAVSVAANLAEGSARISKRDQAHFSQLAYSSLMEVACLLMLAMDQTFITEEVLDDLRAKIASIAFQINALRSSQIRVAR
jgi:four helix bundle protein